MNFKRIEQPIMFAKPKEKWVVVLDEPDNVKLFKENYFSIENEWNVYFKQYDEYYKSLEIENAKANEETRISREEEIKHPPIYESIKAINSKDDLIDYLLSEYLHDKIIFIEEKSIDKEVSQAIFNANYNELKKLKNKFKGDN